MFRHHKNIGALIYNIKISKQQKETLLKLKSRKIKVSCFIRTSIKEKILRDAEELIDKSNIQYCPFSGGTIILKI